MMNEKIVNYINSIFEGAPPTKKVYELKEEILQNTNDKYNDLIAQGKGEDAAYNIAIAGIGDISELLSSMEEKNMGTFSYTRAEIEKDQKRSAILTAIAVMLYITSVIPCILYGLNGPVLMFIMVALATGIIIYNAKTRIKYKKADDTVVEEFKEWQDVNNDKKQLFKAISSAMWTIILIIYFVVSFTTMAWHITWIIFVIGSAVEKIIKACFELRK